MDIWTLPTRAHQDLWWLLTAPKIIHDDSGTTISRQEQSTWLHDAWAWIQRDAIHPENLLEWVNNVHRRRKLGLYAEDLLHYYLHWGSKWRVRWHDVQIREDKRSIGALDFILEHDGQTEHWEMTVKFYLQHTPTGHWKDFIGADERDSLHQKWTHFYDRQLPLVQHPATLARLKEDGIAVPDRSRIWHCGLIFSEWNTPFIPPEQTSWGQSDPAQPVGQWIRRRDFVQHFFNSSKRWAVRPHPHWLAPIETDDALDCIGIMDQPMERGFLMLAEMVPSRFGWRECGRWVLVKNTWGLKDEA
jgi:hypothetical protein